MKEVLLNIIEDKLKHNIRRLKLIQNTEVIISSIQIEIKKYFLQDR